MPKSSLRLLFITLSVLVFSAPARAELVFFASGRTMSVRDYKVEGSQVILRLRAGGEVVCDRALVDRIEPDEVPYPEPEPTETAQVEQETGFLDSTQFAGLIDSISAAQGVDPDLVRAVIQVESAYRPRAKSPKGAMGLMQLMPATARQYAVEDPFDARSNLEGGVRHLKALLGRFELAVALAAYNAGEEAVRKFGGIPPYPETRNYVSRILQLLRAPRSD